MSGFDMYQDEILNEKSDRAQKWNQSENNEVNRKGKKPKSNSQIRRRREEQDEFFDSLDEEEWNRGDDLDFKDPSDPKDLISATVVSTDNEGFINTFATQLGEEYDK
jgi:hypothetical protein